MRSGRYQQLLSIPLFKGISSAEIDGLMACLEVSERTYQRSDVLLRQGERFETLGIVLSGTVQIVKEDFLGNRTIVSTVPVHGLFAEVFAFTPAMESPISAIAAEPCKILWIHFYSIIHVCSVGCAYHTQLIGNMLELLAEKNLQLNRKIDYLSKRSTREKLIAYLLDQAADNHGRKFRIPYSRAELADYLCVDRSAMSRELSRMRAEGLIDYDKELFMITEHIPE